MTRRERHLRIIENMGGQRTDYVLRRMFCRKDRLSNFTDEAIEELAATLVSDWRLEQRMHADNRRRAAAKADGEVA